MNIPAFELGGRINNGRVSYVVHSELWDRFTNNTIDVNFARWTSIKYLNDDASDYNASISTVPNDSGGLYLFYVKCPVITGMTEYPFYIGRAQFTASQNLRKRVKEYFSHFIKDKERPKITRMITLWGEYLHLAFLPLDENPDIVDLEKQLINSLLLPMNDEIPDQDIREAVKAFQ